MMHRLAAAGATGAAAIVPMLFVAAPAAGTGVHAGPAAPVTIAQGLANPRQLAVLNNGSLLVADAGSGAANAKHPGSCFAGEEGSSCVGDTGDATRIANPATRATPGGTKVVKRLFSIADKGSGASDPAGSAATGLDAVSVAPNGHVFGIFTYLPASNLSGEPALVKHEDGQLVELVKGKLHFIADIGAYSIAHPNKGHAKDSDPYGVLAFNNKVYVADAANNTLLVVHKGHVSTVRVFPYRHGSGKDGSFDTVPTSLATDGKGHIFVGTLGSLIPGDGRVYELSLSGKVLRVIKKLSQVDGVAVDSKGNVYATEIFGGQDGPFSSKGAPNGKLITITPSGSRTGTPVPLPGGVVVSRAHLFVSEFSISATLGTVARLR